MIPYGRHSVSALDALRVAKQIYFSSLTQGPKIAELENAVAKYVGAKYAVAVSSATAGLHLALLALNLPKKSEVLTSPISFVASSNAVLYCDLIPRFIDIDPNILCISEELLLSEISKNNKVSALIPVHFAGYVMDLKKTYEASQAFNIKIVEDAAHAFGAKYSSGEMVGSCTYSDITVFSLHPVKTITAGEGGIITTNNFEIYQNLLSLRSHGINQFIQKNINDLLGKTNNIKNNWYHEMQYLGYHYRITEIQATLALSQLLKVDKFVKHRRSLTKLYKDLFSSSNLVKIYPNLNIDESSCHLLVIQIDFNSLNINRNQFMDKLKEFNIGTQVHYKPIPLNPYYKSLGYDVKNLPNTMAYYEKTLSLPLFYGLKIKQIKYISKKVQKLINSSANNFNN